jgi:hypothetical protein
VYVVDAPWRRGVIILQVDSEERLYVIRGTDNIYIEYFRHEIALDVETALLRAAQKEEGEPRDR